MRVIAKKGRGVGLLTADHMVGKVRLVCQDVSYRGPQNIRASARVRLNSLQHNTQRVRAASA